MIIDDYTYCSIETVPNTHGPEWRGPCEQYSVFIQNYIYLSVIDLCRYITRRSQSQCRRPNYPRH